MAADVIVVQARPAPRRAERAPAHRPQPQRSQPQPRPQSTRRVPDAIVIGPQAERANLLAETLLTIGALLGVAVTVLTVLAAHVGLQPLVVRSGSMEPAVPTGSMVLVRRVPASAIRVGDVVTVERADHTRVTHRVVALTRSGPAAQLTLKGDANQDPDPAPVTVTSAQRLVFSAGGVGRFIAWLATPAGGFAVGCLLTAACFLLMRGGRRRVAR